MRSGSMGSWGCRCVSRLLRQYPALVGSSCLSTVSRVSGPLHQLPAPQTVYANNHVLVVDKPSGWHAVPNDSAGSPSDKCLLDYLRQHQLGGGSDGRYLKPVHRLDQPCSGIMVYAKTSRTASRIQSQWSDVVKTYVVRLEQSVDERLYSASSQSSRTGWWTLQGSMPRRRQKHAAARRHGGWSVELLAYDPHWPVDRCRPVELQWRPVSDSVLLVQTDSGARHMIRALLAQIGGRPIAGDVRYQAAAGLPDQSVALHARRLVLPAKLSLGATPREFVAAVPSTWADYFGIGEQYVLEWEAAIRP